MKSFVLCVLIGPTILHCPLNRPIKTYEIDWFASACIIVVCCVSCGYFAKRTYALNWNKLTITIMRYYVTLDTAVEFTTYSHGKNNGPEERG